VVTISGGLSSKPAVTVSSGLSSKHAVTVSGGLTSKPVATIFSNLASKLEVTASPGLASKRAVGFVVEPQNQCAGGFSSLDLKTGSSGLLIWDSNHRDGSLVWVSKPSGSRFVGCAIKPMEGGQPETRVPRRDLAVCFA
jgi:hypothetical protein